MLAHACPPCDRNCFLVSLKVLCNILAVDGVNNPDVLAINGGADAPDSDIAVRFYFLLCKLGVSTMQCTSSTLLGTTEPFSPAQSGYYYYIRIDIYVYVALL